MPLLSFPPSSFTPAMPPPVSAPPSANASSLYVGGLDARVCTELLHDVFSLAGTVTLCRVVSDKHSGVSMGFGFVDYPDHATALKAQQMLHGRVIYGHELTVDWAHANSNAAAGRGHGERANVGMGTLANGGGPRGRGGDGDGGDRGAGISANGSIANGVSGGDIPTANGAGEDISNHYCLFIGNLDASVTDEDLRNAFSAFGKCSSAQVSRDSQSNSRRCAFISFKERSAAQAAIDGLNEQVIAGRPMRVDWARTKTNAVTRAAAMGLPDPDPSTVAVGGASNSTSLASRPLLEYATIAGQTPSTFTTAYISGLPPSIDEETLRAAFDIHGTVSDIRIPESARNHGGDKVYAFVVYAEHDCAARAIFDAQKGLVVAGRHVTVQWGRESSRGGSGGGGVGGRRGGPMGGAMGMGMGRPPMGGGFPGNHHGQPFGAGPLASYQQHQHGQPGVVGHPMPPQHIPTSYSAAVAPPPSAYVHRPLSNLQTREPDHLVDQQRQIRPPY